MKNNTAQSHSIAKVKRNAMALPIILLIMLLILLSTGCNLPAGSSQPFDATKASLDVQATIQAQQVQKDTLATSESSAATQIAQEVQATLVSRQSTQIAEQQAEDEPPPRQHRLPTSMRWLNQPRSCCSRIWLASTKSAT